MHKTTTGQRSDGESHGKLINNESFITKESRRRVLRPRPISHYQTSHQIQKGEKKFSSRGNHIYLKDSNPLFES